MRPILTRVSALALVSALFALPASAVTNLISNGDFETVDNRAGLTVGDSDGDALNSLAGSSGNASWDVYSTLPGGWYTSAGNGIEVQTNLTINGAGSINSLDAFGGGPGSHYIELDSEADGGVGGVSNSSMSQKVSGLSVGRQYLFSFYYSPRTSSFSTDDNLISWLIAPPGVGGSVSGPANGTGTSAGVWTLFETIFTATSEDVVITFSAGGNDNELGGFIDNVSLSLVPLPAGALLIVGAFAGAAAFRRFGRA
mgnify:CR=1 FL=1